VTGVAPLVVGRSLKVIEPPGRFAGGIITE
jgi:hypothetical protein